MQETNWVRLQRLIEERCEQLGMTRGGLNARGGPSSEWVRKLQEEQGAPRLKQAKTLHSLDAPLGWPAGTSWALVKWDRSGWSAEQLAEEEAALLGRPPEKSPVDERSNVRDFKPPQQQTPTPPSPTPPSEREMNEAADALMIAEVCKDTASGWLWHCDEHDTHGNADSREEAEWLADAHVAFHDDLEGSSDRNPCPIIVWSRRRRGERPINQVAVP